MASKKRTGKPGWDQERKVHSNAKLKTLPREHQETLWELLHPTDPTVQPYNVEQCLVHLQEEHQVEVSASTFYEWVSWYGLQLRLDAAAERAEQARLELAKDPSITPEDLDRVAQTVFTAESLTSGNAKVYVQLAKLNLAKKSLDLDAEKFALLKAKAARLDAMEAKAKELKAGGGLTPEALEMLEKELKIL